MICSHSFCDYSCVHPVCPSVPCHQFQKVSAAHYLASPNGTQALIPQLMLLHAPQRIYLREFPYIISADTRVFHSGIPYLRLTSKWPSLRTIRQPGVPRNLSTSRGWLVYVTSGTIYRICFILNCMSTWRITRLALSLPVTYCPLMLRDGPTGSTLTRAPASSPWGLMDETGHDPVTYGL